MSDPEVALDDYNLFRMDRNSSRVDVARASFTCTVLNAITVEKCFEFLDLKVNIAHNESITVVAVYRTPSVSFSAIDKLADF